MSATYDVHRRMIIDRLGVLYIPKSLSWNAKFKSAWKFLHTLRSINLTSGSSRDISVKITGKRPPQNLSVFAKKMYWNFNVCYLKIKIFVLLICISLIVMILMILLSYYPYMSFLVKKINYSFHYQNQKMSGYPQSIMILWLLNHPAHWWFRSQITRSNRCPEDTSKHDMTSHGMDMDTTGNVRSEC